ncbi:MAG: SpoIID/LytB domain-containing protein [Bacteroidaceae bacterium]|nr:SpoIID/LytB domain-containing protein [Bacteroidaceae bacterium]MBQ9176478.1 SpoIID/LytB domain-containing protein [Bacteroidaceae bacterium]
MRERNCREVSVGIVTAEAIELDEGTVTCRDGKICWDGKCYDQLDFTPLLHHKDRFTIHNVTIGKQFHWQRQRQQTFSGRLHFIVEGKAITAVNTLPIEDYLVSVISSEMRATSSLEFLKAHAIIARSWLLAQRQLPQPPHQHYDVCADDHCQRYQGTTMATNPHVMQAVDETRGMVLTCDGNICDTRYSKCCGGRTELFATCWDEHQPHPYLQSVACPYCNTTDRHILQQVLNDYDQETNDFYSWHVNLTHAELDELVQRKSGLNLGHITDLVPLSRGISGRISQLRIVGTEGETIVGKELAIRKTLSPTHLYSSAFDIEHTATGITLNGRGWGHGVGLCQIGAAVMGEQGANHTAILQHYYKNTTLTQLYE